jgi:hypothetical protein
LTDSTLGSPFVLRAAWAFWAFGCFRAELLRRVADPPLDERSLERPFDARAVEPDLEEPDEPRRWDVLVWANVFLSLLGNPFSDLLPPRESE